MAGQTHTDPGANWDWDYYYKLINDPTSSTTVNTNLSGNVTDMGGSGNYTNDERTLFLIQPTNATSIVLTVNSFDTESNWDYLYLYNGTTVFDPLIGRYDGTSIPPTINVNGGAVLIEFRSDCATTSSGYDISWNASVTGIQEMTPNEFIIFPNPAKDQINIEFDNIQTGQITVKDVSGRIVAVEDLIHQKQHAIAIQDFSQGLYFLHYKNRVVRFIKN